MSRNGWWVLGGVLAAVLVLVGGFFLAVEPVLAGADASRQNAASVQSQNQALQVKVAALSRTAAKQGRLEEQDAVLQKAVPTILKPNTFSRRVYEIAAYNGVRLDSWGIGTAQAYTAPQSLTAAAPAPATTTAPTPSASATPAASAAPAAAATGPVLAKTDPLITSANLAVVPVTLQVTGAQDAVLAFTTGIQDDERVLLVNSLTTSRNDDGTTTAAMSGYIYTVQR